MKVVLLGDSITQGLGSKKINFSKYLQSLLKESEIINLALTGTTIMYAMDLVPEIEKINPDYVVILYGNVDAQLRPNRAGKVFKYLPKRFKLNNGSMLSPRPFYSHIWYKKMIQKIENILRLCFRKIIFCVDGSEQWVNIGQYEKNYNSLCKDLVKRKIGLILCSNVFLDEKYFPGSQSEYQKYNEIIFQMSKKYNAKYIDLYSAFMEKVQRDGWRKSYNYDHFHPNEYGYKLIYYYLLAITNVRNT